MSRSFEKGRCLVGPARWIRGPEGNPSRRMQKKKRNEFLVSVQKHFGRNDRLKVKPVANRDRHNRVNIFYKANSGK